MDWLLVFSCGERLTRQSAVAGRLELLCKLPRQSGLRVALAAYGDRDYLNTANSTGKCARYKNHALSLLRQDSHWTLRLLRGAALLLYLGVRLKPRTVYTRDLFSCLVALLLRPFFGYRVIRDVRGVVEEFAFSGRAKGVPYRILERLDAISITKSDTVLAVSRGMVTYVASKYGRKDALFCVPNCVDMSLFPTREIREKVRAEIRIRLNLVGRKVIVYSGGLQRWQMFRETISLFQRIYESDSHYCLLVLTGELEKAKALLVSTGLPVEAFRLTSAPQREIPSILCAADAGICLRQPDLINKVSCPTKVIEYLSAGLNIIISEAVGDISEMVPHCNIGVVLSKNDWMADGISPSILEKINATVDSGFNERSIKAAQKFSASDNLNLISLVLRGTRCAL